MLVSGDWDLGRLQRRHVASAVPNNGQCAVAESWCVGLTCLLGSLDRCALKKATAMK